MKYIHCIEFSIIIFYILHRWTVHCILYRRLYFSNPEIMHDIMMIIIKWTLHLLWVKHFDMHHNSLTLINHPKATFITRFQNKKWATWPLTNATIKIIALIWTKQKEKKKNKTKNNQNSFDENDEHLKAEYTYHILFVQSVQIKGWQTTFLTYRHNWPDSFTRNGFFPPFGVRLSLYVANTLMRKECVRWHLIYETKRKSTSVESCVRICYESVLYTHTMEFASNERISMWNSRKSNTHFIHLTYQNIHRCRRRSVFHLQFHSHQNDANSVRL